MFLTQIVYHFQTNSAKSLPVAPVASQTVGSSAPNPVNSNATAVPAAAAYNPVIGGGNDNNAPGSEKIKLQMLNF